MTMAEKNKKLAAGIAAASVALAGVGVMAYFTDWEKADFGGENGVAIGGNNPVDVVPNDDGRTPTDTTDDSHPGEVTPDTTKDKDGTSDEGIGERWARLNPVALANYNPGDVIDLPVQLYNGGDFPIDVRETFVVTVNGKDRNGADLTFNASDLQFRLRNSTAADGTKYGTIVAADKYGAYDSTDGVDITVEKVEGNKITYTLDPHKMATFGEYIRDYHLVFDKNSLNDFQGATVTVDYIVEAKQSNNTDPSKGWTDIVTESITIGQTTQDVVPAKNTVAASN